MRVCMMEIFASSTPVTYPSMVPDGDVYVQMFDEYFQRVLEEAEFQPPSFVTSCVPPPVSKTQARRISAPVHRMNQYSDFNDSKRQRRSQSLRQPVREFREKACKDVDGFKSPSAPESRSCSYKNKKYRSWRDGAKTKNNDEDVELSLEDPVEKKLQLVKLMQGLDCTVVRTFSTSPRGHLINRGESFRRKQQNQNNITEPSQVTTLAHDGITTDTEFSTKSSSPSEPPKSSPNGKVRKVLVMGDHGVGKTSLLQQFITSEYMGTADPVFDNELEKSVSVQVDDLETTLTFVDLPTESQKAWMQHSDVEAFIVCYSITDRRSFNFAVDLLEELKSNQKVDAAVIIVANKSDLVRARRVFDILEGKSVCQKSSCKFIEVSAAFNHYVDELLVGVVHQIRLNPKRGRAKSVPNTGSNSSTEALLSSKSFSFGCFRGARVFLSEFLFGSKKTKSRSCDNLWTL